MDDVVEEPRDRGESLIELIVAIFILGVVAVAVVTSLAMAIRASKANRDEAIGSATLRNYAEWLENATYQSNATISTTAYQYPAGSVPSGYRATLSAVKCWSNVATPASGLWGSCSGSRDKGIQQITINVSSIDGLSSENLNVVLRKPCAIGTSTSC